METSALFAKLFGGAYALLGLGLLLNGAYYKKVFKEMMKSRLSTFFGAVFAFILGGLMVNFHNLWVADWRVVITIFGWLGLIKGVTLFVAPKPLLKISKPIIGCTRVLGVSTLVFGSALLYCGFFL